ncbi:hypothetical protein ACLOJK_041898 [Asimina triloba]
MRRLQQSVGDRFLVEPPPPESVDSDVVVILASLLCALICVVGLALVARCAWLRRFTSPARGRSAASASRVPPAAADKGLKKKELESIPTVAYDGGEKLADCAICLTEFAEGDAIRVLPQCGHGFHVGCVDAWLGSHSSCPSCRRVLAVGRCQKCGGVSGVEGEAKPSRPAEEENGGGGGGGGDGDGYLP